MPREARGAFAIATPCLVAVWALAGFYLSLGPSLAAQQTHSDNLAWGGVLILLLHRSRRRGSIALRKREPPRVMLGGCLVLIAGAVVTFGAIETTMPAFFSSAQRWPASASARRSWAPTGPSSHWPLQTIERGSSRRSTWSATRRPSFPPSSAASRRRAYGLHDTALVYSLVVAALAAAGAGSFLARRMGGGRERGMEYPDPPPGPCTAPPCLPTPARGESL